MRAGAGAVGFGTTLLKHKAQKVVVLLHDAQSSGNSRAKRNNLMGNQFEWAGRQSVTVAL
jgi:hypothetical protein